MIWGYRYFWKHPYDSRKTWIHELPWLLQPTKPSRNHGPKPRLTSLSKTSRPCPRVLHPRTLIELAPKTILAMRKGTFFPSLFECQMFVSGQLADCPLYKWSFQKKGKGSLPRTLFAGSQTGGFLGLLECLLPGCPGTNLLVIFPYFPTFQIPSKSKSRSDLPHQNLAEFYAKNHPTFPTCSLQITLQASCWPIHPMTFLPRNGTAGPDAFACKLVAFVSNVNPSPTAPKSPSANMAPAAKKKLPNSHEPSVMETHLLQTADRVSGRSRFTLPPIIMVQWKITLNKSKLILEIHPFSTEPWLWEEGYTSRSTPMSIRS